MKAFPHWGSFCMVSIQYDMFSVGQLESARRVITTGTKRNAKVWRPLLVDLPKTKKPKESRMGKGKGAFFKWIVPISAGTVLFEYSNVARRTTKQLELIAKNKMSVKTKILKNFF